MAVKSSPQVIEHAGAHRQIVERGVGGVAAIGVLGAPAPSGRVVNRELPDGAREIGEEGGDSASAERSAVDVGAEEGLGAGHGRLVPEAAGGVKAGH